MRVYLVGGAGAGLGSALVSLLASQGAAVVATARQGKSLARLEAAAKSASWTFRPVVADLKNPTEVEALVAGVLREFGHLDGVAALAGGWMPGSPLLHESSERDWEEGLSNNLRPVYCLSHATLPALIREGHGSLVFVSATRAVRWAGTAAYGAAKGALLELCEKMAHDYRPYGIRVNAVLPGNMPHNVDPATRPGREARPRLKDNTETGAWEVAQAISFLLSPEAEWITGSTIVIDGGRSTGGEEQRD
jgi:NAD(P)-dependent dehydrogenase (short-subunit alcohol dehydrogenase family)